MVVIRLSRGGAKKRPFYNVVAADSRNARDGRNLEKLGYFDPLARGEAIRLSLNKERVEYWLSVGAKPSDRVSALLKEQQRIDAGLPAKAKKPKKKATPVAADTAEQQGTAEAGSAAEASE